MSNFDTITSITDNMESVLRGLGINFTREYDDDVTKIPAGSLPLGQLFYDSETFENIYNERPQYVEVSYRLRVLFRIVEGRALMREQQRWAHLIRDALTVSALNINDLVTTQYVSRVQITGIEADVINDSMAAVIVSPVIRYREQ